MFRRFAAISALYCLTLAGCGSGEVGPTTEPTQNISADAMQQGMQESLKHMPPEQRAKMEQQMKNMPVMQQSGSAPVGSATTP